MIKNQKMKKLLSLFLSILIVLSSMNIVFAESQEIKGHWAENQLNDWIDRGLVTGYVDGTYKPNNKIKRSEFIALVNRLYQFDEKSEPNFTDVSAQLNLWVYEEVSKAAKAGYINGFVDGSFKPNDNITRQEVAAIVSRIEKLEPNADVEMLKSFADVNDIPEWSKAYIGAVVEIGYMRGTPENKFKALNQISRAEVVTALDRAATKDIAAADAKPLFDAIKKQQDIKTMESKSSLYFTINASGLSEEEQVLFDGILDAVNSAEINTASKAVMNDEGTKTTTETNLSVNVMGTNVDTAVWMDMDMSGDTQKLTEIIQIPEILSYYMPEELQGKDYLVIDESQSADLENTVNTKELMEATKKLQDQLIAFVEKYMDNANSDSGIIKYRGIKVINTAEGNEYAAIYQIRLDDASLKAVIKDSVNDLAQDEEFITLIKEYMLTMAEFEVDPEAKAELEKAAAELENNTGAFIDSFNKAMDILDDVTLIGSRGIVIDYTVNDEGYIINEKGNADFIIDLSKLNKALAQIAGEAAEDEAIAGVFTIGIDFDTDIFNINGDVRVEMPELTAENSMTIDELMEAFAASQEYLDENFEEISENVYEDIEYIDEMIEDVEADYIIENADLTDETIE